MALPKIKPYTYIDREHSNRVSWPVDPGRAVLLVHDMQVHFVQAFEGANLGESNGNPDAQINVAIKNLRRLIDAAHAAGAAALFSEHHFDATPATDAMADTLTGMADAGADIAKLAVMPRCAADAARLLEATARAADARPDTPLITMSMGPLGAVTRFCGGAFGSCATFGVTSGTSASAPGQPPADVLKAKLITAPPVMPL